MKSICSAVYLSVCSEAQKFVSCPLQRISMPDLLPAALGSLCCGISSADHDPPCCRLDRMLSSPVSMHLTRWSDQALSSTLCAHSTLSSGWPTRSVRPCFLDSGQGGSCNPSPKLLKLLSVPVAGICRTVRLMVSLDWQHSSCQPVYVWRGCRLISASPPVTSGLRPNLFDLRRWEIQFHCSRIHRKPEEL